MEVNKKTESLNVQSHHLKCHLQTQTKDLGVGWGEESQLWQAIMQNTVKKGMVVCRLKSGLVH